MRSLLALWSAATSLASALESLASTIRQADAGLRDRLQLDQVEHPQPAIIDATVTEPVTEPTTEPKPRRSRS